MVAMGFFNKDHEGIFCIMDYVCSPGLNSVSYITQPEHRQIFFSPVVPEGEKKKSVLKLVEYR